MGDSAERTCKVCGFVSVSVSALRWHEYRTCRKRAASADPFKCKGCKKKFRLSLELLAHMKKCLNKTCSSCGKVYARADYRRKHERACQSSGFSNSCATCNMNFKSKARLIKHIKGCVLGDPEKFFDFKSKREMDTWIEAMQLKTKAYFSQHGGEKVLKSGTYTYKYCQHNKQEQHSFNPKTDRHRKSGQVPDFGCLAKLSICQKDNIFKVTFHSSHIHACKEEYLKNQPLPASLRREIKIKNEMGIAPKRIYDDEKAEKWSRENRTDDMEIDIRDHLTIRYIKKRRSEMNRSKFLVSDDATSTHALVLAMSKEKYNSVLIYKPYQNDVMIGDCAELATHPDFNNLFCVGLQTEKQALMMGNHAPKILCGDDTHGLTSYGFFLFTLVIKDDTGKAYPVAYLITSHKDSLVLTCFFRETRKRVKGLTISWTMSDDDEATKKAFRDAFGDALRKVITLLCQWHVPRNWKKNIGKVAIKSSKDELLFLLKKAMYTKDKNEYHQIVHVILNDYECDDYIIYLENYYFNRPEEWASSFRLFFHDGVDTNMLCEALHNILKTVELERQVNRRVDTLINLIMRVEDERNKSYVMEKSMNLDPPLVGPTQRHSDGLRIPDANVKVHNSSPDCWEVASCDEPGKKYMVTRAVSSCTLSHCYISCPAVACYGLCMHLFWCDCPDNSPMCKHIHKVQAKTSRNKISRLNSRVSAAPVPKPPKLPAVTTPVPPAVTTPVPPAVTTPVPPAVTTAASSMQAPIPINIPSDSDEEEEVDCSRLLRKHDKLVELLKQGNLKSIPQSLILACEGHLDKCILLLSSGASVAKKLKSMPTLGHPKPNSRLQKQIPFQKKKKSTLPRKNEAAIARAQEKLGKLKAAPPLSQAPAPLVPKVIKVAPPSGQAPVPPAPRVIKVAPPSGQAPVPPAPRIIMVAPPSGQAPVPPAPRIIKVAPPSGQAPVPPAPRVIKVAPPSGQAPVPPAPRVIKVAPPSGQAPVPPAPRVIKVAPPSGQALAPRVIMLTPPSAPAPPAPMVITLTSPTSPAPPTAFRRRVNDVDVTSDDIESLDGWLLDSAIDVPISFLVRKYPHIYALKCSEVLALHEFRSEPPSQRSRPLVDQSKTKLLMPLNTTKVHWTLLVYDRVEKCFTLIDPLSYPLPDEQIMQRIKLCLQAWYGIECQDAELHRMRSVRQGDGRSCGLFVVHFAEMCAKGLPYTTPCDPEEYRTKIRKLMLEG